MALFRKRLYLALGVVITILGGAATLMSRETGVAPVRSAVAAESVKVAQTATRVDAAQVISRIITDYQQYSGRLEAVNKVDIRPLVSGTIVAVHFADGTQVKKGDSLFTIDPRPYVAALDRASADLAAAQARSSFEATDAARAERLLSDNAIAKRDYDEKQNSAREAAANLKGAQAALDLAKIKLSYTKISAPVSGKVSRAEMTVGNVVSAGSGAPLLTTVVSLSPIYASFDVDEQTYLRYLSHDSRVSVPVSLGLANESSFSRYGKIASVDNRLDTGSGTIRVRASFDNADGSLIPGLYARVKVGAGVAHAAVLIDDAVIGTDQDKKFVLVVDQNGHAQYREIVLGAQQDGLRIVEKGLRPYERIIVNGLQHVRPNDLVSVNMVSMAGETLATKNAQ